MRRVLMLLLLAAPVALMAQLKPFVAEGKIGTWNSPASLSYQLDGKQIKIDTRLKDGVFKFSGNLPRPVPAYFSIYYQGEGKMGEAILLWIEPGTMRINSKDSLTKIVITGSRINDEIKQLHKALSATQAKSNRLYEENLTVGNNQSEQDKLVYEKKLKEIEAEREKVTIEFIRSHPSSLYSLSVLSTSLSRSVPDVALVDSLFKKFSPSVKNSPEGKKYAESLETWKSVNVGSVAPNFSQPDEYNKPVKLSDLRGKYVLLDFWASWCHPCRDEHPNLIKQYGLYKDKGFTILSLSLDGGGFGTKAAWLKAIQDDGVGAWFHVCDLTGSGRNAIGKMYGVGSIPENFLIDPDGKIIAKSLRGIDLALELEKLFTNK